MNYEETMFELLNLPPPPKTSRLLIPYLVNHNLLPCSAEPQKRRTTAGGWWRRCMRHQTATSRSNISLHAQWAAGYQSTFGWRGNQSQRCEAYSVSQKILFSTDWQDRRRKERLLAALVLPRQTVVTLEGKTAAQKEGSGEPADQRAERVLLV